MAAQTRVLRTIFDGDSKGLKRSSEDSERAIENVRGRFAGFGAAAVAAGAVVGAAVVGVGKVLLDIGETFDGVADTIRANTGATGEQLDGLVDSAKKVGTSVPSSFEDVGTAIAGLHQRLGFTGPALEATAVQILNLSRLTKTDLQGNIEGITRVFANWGLGMDDQADAMDRMYRTTQLTGVGIKSLQENLVKFGEPLRQLGFNFQQSLAVLGSFERSGVNTEVVLKGLGKSLMKFAKDGEAPAKALERVVKSIKNAGSTADANKIAVELFGKSGIEMAGAIRSGKFEIDELTKTIGNSTGTINAAAEDTADFAEQWQILKNKAFVALEPVASRLFSMIGEKMEILSDWFDENEAKVTAFAGALSVGLSVAVDVLGIVVAAAFELGSAIGVVVGWIADHLKPLLIGLSPILVPLAIHFAVLGVKATIAASQMAAAWLVAQVGAVRASVATALASATIILQWTLMAARATVSALVMAAAWVIAFVAGAALAVATMIATAVAVVARWTMMAAGAMARAAVMAAAWFVALGPVGWVIAAIIGLVALIIANWDTVVRWTKQAWQAVVGAVTDAWNWITRKTGEAKDWILARIIDLVHFFATIGSKILDAIGNLGDLLKGVGRDIVNGLWAGISGGWDWLTNQVSSLAKRLLQAAKNALGIGSPSKLFRRLIGRWIPPGIAMGVKDTSRQAVGAVRGLGERLVGAAPTLGSMLSGRMSQLLNEGAPLRPALPGGESIDLAALGPILGAAMDEALRGVFADGVKTDVDYQGLTLRINAQNRNNARR